MPFSMPNSPMPPRPTPKPEVKPQTPQRQESFLGKPGEAPSWDTLKSRARAFPWEKSVLPGTSRKLGEEERVKFIEKLQKLDLSSGAISEQGFKERILPKLKEEMRQLSVAGKTNEKEDLKRKMKMFGMPLPPE